MLKELNERECELKYSMRYYAGTGTRYQKHIDEIVDKINILRKKMGSNQIVTPKLHDDGFGGMLSGIHEMKKIIDQYNE